MKFIVFFLCISLLYLTQDDLCQVMDDEVIVVAEGINGTVMKINEIQVRQKALMKSDNCFIVGWRKDISSISSSKSSLSS
jgi:hypothetical protein